MLSSSLFKMKFRQTLLHYAVATCLYCFHIYDLCWNDRRWRRIGHIKSKAHWLSRNKRNDTWQISQRSECDHCEWKILHWFAISSSNRKVAWLNKLKFRLVIFLSFCNKDGIFKNFNFSDWFGFGFSCKQSKEL